MSEIEQIKEIVKIQSTRCGKLHLMLSCVKNSRRQQTEGKVAQKARVWSSFFHKISHLMLELQPQSKTFHNIVRNPSGKNIPENDS